MFRERSLLKALYKYPTLPKAAYKLKTIETIMVDLDQGAPAPVPVATKRTEVLRLG